MAKSMGEAEYPIAAVSKLTGVSCHALRVWERRYGFPIPHRTASGHRRYGIDQVTLLRQISAQSHSGRAIGDLIADLRSGRLVVPPATDAVASPLPTARPELVDFVERMASGDLSGGASCFDRVEAHLNPEELVTQVIAPALTETGERWFNRRCSVYQERCISGFLRRKLDTMIDVARRRNEQPEHTALLTTVQGDRHEGGLLIANLLLEYAGWRVVNLGTDLPVAELARAAEQLRPDALALSFVLSRNINKRFQELSRIHGLPIFVGGRSILNYQSLARRYGLIPVPGGVTDALCLMFREYQGWANRSQSSTPH